MKCKKLMATILATAMFSGVVGIMPVIAEDSEIVYTYTNEFGETVNITQDELDAEHWNKEALEDTAPIIYEEFPMKIEGFVNDFAELSLDIVYMKKLNEMQSVHLKITDMSDESIVYDADLTQSSFYSPLLEANNQYIVRLTEVIDGVTSEYERVVITNEFEPDMPDYIYGTTQNGDSANILIQNIDVLRAGQSVGDNGEIIINTAVSKYDKVPAADFESYCNSLDQTKTYRVFTDYEDTLYEGFIKFENEDMKIFDYDIDVCTLEEFYMPSIASAPSLTTSQILSVAQELRLSDSCFHLWESGNYAKFATYELSIPEEFVDGNPVEDGNYPIFKITVKGSSKITARLYTDTGNSSGTTLTRSSTSNNNENSVTFTINSEDYKDESYASFYVMVYFYSAVEGYGMINYESILNYSDDVTGSIYNAYNGESCYSTLSNTEFSLTDSWDVDAFAFDYWLNRSTVYKIELKNRSLAEQAQLENGTMVTGSRAKYLTLWSIDASELEVQWFENGIYTIEKNQDTAIYVDPFSSDVQVFSIMNVANGITTSNNYQLAFSQIS